MCFGQLLACGCGIVFAHPGAERADPAREIAHGVGYPTGTEQDQDEGEHDRPVRQTESSHDSGSTRRTHVC
jgi:hypothetical protein